MFLPCDTLRGELSRRPGKTNKQTNTHTMDYIVLFSNKWKTQVLFAGTDFSHDEYKRENKWDQTVPKTKRYLRKIKMIRSLIVRKDWASFSLWFHW